jgi:hypothetical protein|tara:strand:- start:2621 stop:2836 length:216 start_codon:yes stop_codon:yes gene_type:complete
MKLDEPKKIPEYDIDDHLIVRFDALDKNVIAVSGNTEFTDLQPNAQDEIDHFTGGHYYVVKVIERVGYHGN